MTDQPASTAPLAAGLPLVQGRCPACGSSSLFLGNGGYVTCSCIDCPEPDAASTVLERPITEKHPDDIAQCWRNEPHAPHTWTLSPEEGGVDCPGIDKPTPAPTALRDRELEQLRAKLRLVAGYADAWFMSGTGATRECGRRILQALQQETS